MSPWAIWADFWISAHRNLVGRIEIWIYEHKIYASFQEILKEIFICCFNFDIVWHHTSKYGYFWWKQTSLYSKLANTELISCNSSVQENVARAQIYLWITDFGLTVFPSWLKACMKPIHEWVPCKMNTATYQDSVRYMYQGLLCCLE